MSKKKQGMLFGIKIDLNSSGDEQDDEYVPQSDPEEKKQTKAEANKNSEKYLQKKKERVAQIWAQMNEEGGKKSVTKALENSDIKSERALQIASELMEQNKSNNQKTVIFAGKSYKIDSHGTFLNTGEKEEEIVLDEAQVKIKDQENEGKLQERERENRKERFKYLSKILEKINSKTRVINSMAKSKMDWKQYSTKERMDKKFEQNRKNGFLEKQKFINNTNERAYEIATRRKKIKTDT